MAHAPDRFNGKQLYIAHLATRVEAMERAGADVNAISYRLWSRRLLAALAGFPEPLLASGLARTHPSIGEALEYRHFDAHGTLPGAAGQRARRTAERLLRKLTSRHD